MELTYILAIVVYFCFFIVCKCWYIEPYDEEPRQVISLKLWHIILLITNFFVPIFNVIVPFFIVFIVFISDLDNNKSYWNNGNTKWLKFFNRKIW